MVKKQETDQNVIELKSKLIDKKVILGKERVIKMLRNKEVEKVFLAANCQDDVKEDIKYYAGLVDIPVVELSLDNEEVGVLCKKNFFVSVLGTKA